jgi:hypothetical protein
VRRISPGLAASRIAASVSRVDGTQYGLASNVGYDPERHHVKNGPTVDRLNVE